MALTPKTLDLLLVLVENQGRVLSKETLLETVWPGTFVEEVNLSKGIHLLRKALGEGYVETLSKRGYRFRGIAVDGLPVQHREATVPVPRSPSRWLRLGVLAATSAAIAASSWLLVRSKAPPQLTSVAVLPFANLSPDPEDEYLSQGMTEELIDRLTGIPNLRVIARTSASRFQGKALDFQKISRSLGVDAVLEGTVRRANSRMVANNRPR